MQCSRRQSRVYTPRSIGGSRNFDKGGGDGRQFISSVLIYRKYTEQNISILHGKSGFLKKRANRGREGGRPTAPPPFESATDEEQWHRPRRHVVGILRSDLKCDNHNRIILMPISTVFEWYVM